MERTIDGKTLTIKHFINKQLKPSISDGATSYPLYTQVIFDTYNTRFKTTNHTPSWGNSGILIDEKYEDQIVDGSFFNKHFSEVLEVDRKILDIIEYEIKTKKSEFTLRGLGKRLQNYFRLVREALSDQGKLGKEVLNMLGDYIPYNEFKPLIQANYHGTVHLLKTVAEKYPHYYQKLPLKYTIYLVVNEVIIQTASDITYFEWLHKNGKESFQSALINKIGNNSESTEVTYSIVNQIDTSIKETIT